MQVPTQPCASPSKEVTPLYAESVNMLEGLADEEVARYLKENPQIVPLFEVDVAEAVSPYIVHPNDASEELDRDAIQELHQVQEALEWEMAVSQRVKASQLEEVNLGTREETRPVHVAKEMPPEEKSATVILLKEVWDVFAWSYEDMQGLDLHLYQHQIHLSKDAKPIAQRLLEI